MKIANSLVSVLFLTLLPVLASAKESTFLCQGLTDFNLDTQCISYAISEVNDAGQTIEGSFDNSEQGGHFYRDSGLLELDYLWYKPSRLESGLTERFDITVQDNVEQASLQPEISGQLHLITSLGGGETETTSSTECVGEEWKELPFGEIDQGSFVGDEPEYGTALYAGITLRCGERRFHLLLLGHSRIAMEWTASPAMMTYILRNQELQSFQTLSDDLAEREQEFSDLSEQNKKLKKRYKKLKKRLRTLQSR